MKNQMTKSIWVRKTPGQIRRAHQRRVRKLVSVSIRDHVIENAYQIERWSDFEFMTPNGNRFGLFLIGDSIRHRFAAVNCGFAMVPESAERMSGIAGFIQQIGAGEPNDRPLVISEDHEELSFHWWELHRAYGVPLTDDEMEVLDLEQIPIGDEGENRPDD